MSVESNASYTTFPQRPEPTRLELFTSIAASLCANNATETAGSSMLRSDLQQSVATQIRTLHIGAELDLNEFDEAINELAAVQEITISTVESSETAITLNISSRGHHNKEIERSILLGMFEGVSLAKKEPLPRIKKSSCGPTTGPQRKAIAP